MRTHGMEETGRERRGGANVRGSTIKISVRVAAVKFDDAREVTDRPLELHSRHKKRNTQLGAKSHLSQLVEGDAAIVIRV